MATVNDTPSVVSTDLNIKEKVDFLFKNYLGFPNTLQGKAYYNETSKGTSNNYLNGADVFINPIPAGESVSFTLIYHGSNDAGSATAELKEKINLPDTLIDATNYPNIKVYEDTTGVILKYENVPTTAVTGSEVVCPNGSGGTINVPQSYIIPGRASDGTADPNKNVLHDTIQANVEQYFDSNDSLEQPYGYELFDTVPGSSDNAIIPGEVGGNFIVDVKNGVINFTDIESTKPDGNKGLIAVRLDGKPPLISFSKYNGVKGIANVISASADGNNTFTDISVNRIQTNKVAIGSNFADLSAGILLDLCANRFADGSGAIVLPKGTTAQRPWADGNTDYDAQGALRYNTTTKQFEGFSSQAWQGLGGVTDIDGETKITAAHGPTSDGQDRRLRVFVDGSLNMVFDGSGNVAIGYNYDTNDQTAQGTGFSGTDVSFNDNTNLSLHGDMSMNGVLYMPTLAVDSDADAAATTKFVKRAINNLIANAPDTLDTLEEIANVLGDPATDPSGNSPFSVLRKIQDLSDNLDGLAVNANMQKLFEIQTQQPGKFQETDHDEKAGAITLKWSYNSIRAVHSNVKANMGLRAHMSSTNDAITDAAPSNGSENVDEVANYGIKASKLPYIHQIHIDISGVPSNISYANGEQASAYMTGDSGKWVPLNGSIATVQLNDGSNRLDSSGNLVLANNEDYDTQKFRTLILGKVSPDASNNTPLHNILGKDFPNDGHKFDVRIYGVNFSENFPTKEDRALVFKDLSFAAAAAPTVKATTSNVVTVDSSDVNGGTHNLQLDSIVIDESEQGVPGSTAKVTEVQYKYTESASVRSASVSATTQRTEVDPVNANESQDGDTITNATINDLSAGVLYEMESVAMKNDINPSFGTAKTDVGVLDKYTSAPKSSDDQSESDANLISLSLNGASDSILDPTDNANTGAFSGNHRYLRQTSDNLVLGSFVTDNDIEVSKASSSVVAIDGTNDDASKAGSRLGKSLDGKSDVVVVKAGFTGGALASADEINIAEYNGFDTSSAGDEATITDASLNTNYCNELQNGDTKDPYEGTNNRGFRIVSKLPLKTTITGNELTARSVDADDQAYTLTYTLTRNNQDQAAPETSTVKFFRDDFDDDATADVSTAENGIFVSSITRVGGLPSVNEVDMTLKVALDNLCSSHKLVHSNRIAASLGNDFAVNLQDNFGIANTAANKDYKFTNYGDVSDNKIMTKNSGVFAGATMSAIQYSADNSGTVADWGAGTGDKQLVLSVTPKNLKGNGAANTKDLSTNFLRLSTNAPSGDSYFFKKDKSPPDDGSGFGDLDVTGTETTDTLTSWSSINSTQYDFSSTADAQSVRDKMLLWLNGKFQTNAQQKYPNVTTYRWDISSNGDIHTDIDTQKEFTYNSHSGYRWVVHKFTTPANATEAATGINVSNMISSTLGISNAVDSNNLFERDGTNGIAFILFRNGTDANKLRIGNCSKNHNLENWYKQSAESNFSDLLSSNLHGCGPLNAVKFPGDQARDAYLVIGLKDAYNP